MLLIKLPYFKLYTDDWLSSPAIQANDLAYSGAYMTLLCYQWKHQGCQLPDDIPYLLQLLRRQIKEPKLRKILENHFELIELEPVNNLSITTKKNRFWRNPRLYAEFSEALRKGQIASDNATARWNAERVKVLLSKKSSNAPVEQLHYDGDAIHSHSQNTPQEIAEKKGEEAWLDFVDAFTRHREKGERLVITSKLARSVFYQFGGSKGILERFQNDTDKLHTEFVKLCAQADIETFKKEKRR